MATVSYTEDPLVLTVNQNIIVRPVFEQEANVRPTANFTFTTSGLTATFRDTSSDSDGTIVSRRWEFGDGSTSTETNPTRTYATGGAYSVKLIVTDDRNGTSEKIQEVTVSATQQRYTVTTLVETITNNTTSQTTTGGNVELGPRTDGSIQYSRTSPQQFIAGASVSLRAIVNAGYEFLGWKELPTGNVDKTKTEINITVTQNTTLTAQFRSVDGGDGGTTWRNCTTGVVSSGSPPSGWVQKSYSGGGVCYEAPEGTVTFEPTLQQALQFVHTRGETYPSPVTIRAVNPSSVYAYSVTLEPGDNKFVFTPSTFTVRPSSQTSFTAVPTQVLIDALPDGTAELSLKVTINRTS